MFELFELFPGRGIGSFALGESMFTCMAKLGGKTDLVFLNGGDLINVMQLPEFGINLTFDAKMQRLAVIEVMLSDRGYPMMPNMLQFNREPIKRLDFKSIYNRVFGPTYPGFLDKDGDYYLSYDGIAFKFSSIGKAIEVKDNVPSALIQEMNTCHKDISCNSIFIVNKGTRSWNETLNKLKAALETDCPTQKLRYLVQAKNETPANRMSHVGKYPMLYPNNAPVCVESGHVSISDAAITLKFSNHPLGLTSFYISVGLTNMQQIVKCLGPPCDSLNKKVNLPGFGHKVITIHNYFKVGIDVVYHPGQPSYVEKVVIHNNSIQSLEFMKYDRLNVVFTPKKPAQNTVTTSQPISPTQEGYNYTKWDSLATILNLKIDKPPIFLDRKGYELNEEFAQIELDDDPKQTGSTPNVDLDKWALTKLIITENAIFEILLNDNSLSTVTLQRNK